MLSVNRLIRLVLIGGIALTTSASAQAAEPLRLATIAAADGFTYQPMAFGAGATLERPGVRIVIRAGRLFYEVNDTTPVADSAPVFDGRDLLISKRLADHLRLLARKFPYPASAELLPERTAVHGALTISAHQIPGRDALALSGSGPAGIAVTITLLGEVSSDLPVVTLLQEIVQTTADGKFSAEAYYGQDTHVGTFLAATATSIPGVSSAATRVTISLPSNLIKSSQLDVWPSK